MSQSRIDLTDNHKHDPFFRMVDAVFRTAEDLRKITPALLDARWASARRLARKPLEEGQQMDAGIRGKGSVSDPTGEAGADLRRMRLREEVRTAEGHVRKAYAYLAGAHAALDRALAEWEGEHLPPS